MAYLDPFKNTTSINLHYFYNSPPKRSYISPENNIGIPYYFETAFNQLARFTLGDK